ncbi:MAG: CpaF family protein [Chloroflexi bacterium]|nr:CpaF family protein [Chloroflexota bacterium]
MVAERRGGVAGGRPVGPEREAERALRDAVRAALDGRVRQGTLDEGRMLRPGPEEEAEVRKEIRRLIAEHQRVARTSGGVVLADEAATEARLVDALLKLGILQPLLDDGSIEEIEVNGPSRVFVVRDGRTELLPELYFDDDEELRRLVKRIVGPLGRRLDEASPMVDVRLPDGSRLNAVIPPAAEFTAVTIRKFLLRAQSLDQLVRLGTLPAAVAQFLDAAVRGGVNILVSGPTGSGKTTLLNALGAAIVGLNERIVVVEETAELKLSKLPNAVSLQGRAANVEGAGEITIRDLVRNALRMRPTRIVVGEVRGAEALDMLDAMNTGHDGSLTTIHGNSPRDALARLRVLALRAEERVPAEALGEMIASTVGLVVQLRLDPRSGERRVSGVFEVTGLEGATIVGQDLWTIDDGGRLAWTGRQPRCLERIAARGIDYTPPPAVARPRRGGAAAGARAGEGGR